MDPGKPGWLPSLVSEAVSSHVSALSPALKSALEVLPAGRGRARAYLRLVLRERGLWFGPPGLRRADGGTPHEAALFEAVLRAFIRVAMDLAVLADAPPGPRAEQVLLLLAAVAGRLDAAREVDRRILRIPEQWPLPKRLWRSVESALEERKSSLAGDPYYGLLLHSGSVRLDASVFGHLAIDYFATGSFDEEAAERKVRFGACQKALLVEVLTALACADRAPSFPARRAILRQVDDLSLPADVEAALRRRVKRAFDRRPALSELLAGVKSGQLKRFLLEQALLAALVEGRRSRRELAFLRELSQDEVRALEREVADFYRSHRDVVDVFTAASGAEVLGEEVVDSVQRSLEKNFRRLLTEIRETGELSVLLSRAARGQPLSADERRRMRAQLVDLAKAIPALAIFAAPGGVLLLIALAKVLPFNILPSAFQDEPDEGTIPPERAGDG